MQYSYNELQERNEDLKINNRSLINDNNKIRSNYIPKKEYNSLLIYNNKLNKDCRNLAIDNNNIKTKYKELNRIRNNENKLFNQKIDDLNIENNLILNKDKQIKCLEKNIKELTKENNRLKEEINKMNDNEGNLNKNKKNLRLN